MICAETRENFEIAKVTTTSRKCFKQVHPVGEVKAL